MLLLSGIKDLAFILKNDMLTFKTMAPKYICHIIFFVVHAWWVGYLPLIL